MLKIKILIVLPMLLIITSMSYSQEAESLIDIEMLKIQEEFQQNNVTPQNEIIQEEIPISQQEILNELSKPGNENLLEQIKQLPEFQKLEQPEDEYVEEKEESEEDIKKREEEERLKQEEDEEERIRRAKATMQGLLFEDNYAYYESIKDFYGYDIFLRFSTKSQEIGYAPNSNYIVGPGDELILTLWGDTELQKTFKINSEGTAYISDIGVVSLHGYRMSDLRDRFKGILSKRFRTIDPPTGKPSTFFDVTLNKLKSINIFVNGEVIAPGSYSLSSYATILDALQIAKGVSAKGTLRSILLIRDGKVINELDIYDFLMTGKSINDINLRDGDNIFVGPRIGTVQLEGEVLRPLRYELKSTENLSDLIKYSGGLIATSATDRIKIERIIPFEERISPVVTTKVIDVQFTEIVDGKIRLKPISLHNHDVVTVHPVPRLLTDYVVLEGAVYRKGRYSYEKDSTVKDLLLKAGGYLADAFINRVELIRTMPDNSTEYHCLDLEKDGLNFLLSNKDSINIRSEWALKSRRIVLITGYIEKQGFHYLSENTRISDLIFIRGGIEDDKHRKNTYLKRADLIRYNDDGITTRIIPINLEKVLEGDQAEDLILQDRDHLKIYSNAIYLTSSKVRIAGYVKNPDEYPLSENMTAEDLIYHAQGFIEGAEKYKATVFRMKRNRTENDSISQVYEVDLDKDFIEKGKVDSRRFILRDKDLVVVRRHPDYIELRNVAIYGEVRNPGVYSLISKGETFEDLIDRAGGLTSEAFVEGTYLLRDSIRIVSDFKKAVSGSKSSSIFLKQGDYVRIPKKTGVVEVSGFVYTPGSIAYQKGWSISDYIKAAGGTIQDYEYIPTSPVIYYPGGNAKIDDSWFFSPEVLDGSKIVVSSVKREPDTNWAQELRTWLGVMTSALTVIVLIDAVYDK